MGEPFAGCLWIVMPLSVALGASLITAVLVRARAEVEMAQQREALVQTQSLVLNQRQTMEERLNAVWETARREAFDEFLGDVRVEELPLATDRSIQRVCFREIPLTPWISVPREAVEARGRLAPVLDVARATCPSPASVPRSGTGRLHRSSG